MLSKFKKLLSLFALLALLVAQPFSVLAQTFSDVTEDAWYYSYVEQLAQKGIVAPNVFYRPDDKLTRAELATMVVRATDGLSEYVAPEVPTFEDVGIDSPFYDYIEAAAFLGFFTGYTDENGNRTGLFGPNDMVTRAAATKVLARAFDFTSNADTSSVFPDVTRDYWYYDFIVGAYEQSIADGYENGYFGPADFATRAQIAKLIANAMNPVDRSGELKAVAGVEEVPEEGDGEQEIVAEESSLVVSLNSVQPPPYTLPIGSSGPLLTIDLAAGGSDVHVSEITLTRSGVGAASDWYGIYAYEGNFKITSEYAVSRSSNKVRIPMSVFVKAGTSTSLLFYGSSDVVARPLNQHTFFLESAADIVSDAHGVTGDFPLSGNTLITFGGQLTNTLTMTPGTTLSRPERDQMSEIASFKLTAGASSDVGVKVLILTQGGTFSSSKMTDCSLYRTDELIAKAAGFYQDQLIFAPETPYVIPAGQNRSFFVECYINGGRSTDTIQLYLDETYDLITQHMDYGYSAVPINGYSRVLAPSYQLKPAEIIISQ